MLLALRRPEVSHATTFRALRDGEGGFQVCARMRTPPSMQRKNPLS
jgi:hypothetical protein